MKGICYLICAGEQSALNFTPTEKDFVIAVDGGYEYAKKCGMRVDVALGDFDSLGYVPQGETIVLNPIKDDTDTFVAIAEGWERNYRRFELYSALGGRLSHTLANVNCLKWIKARGGHARIISDGTSLEIIDGVKEFPSGGYLSLIALTSTAEVLIENCKYSGKFTLTDKDSLGVSNEPYDNAKVQVVSGEVLAVSERE
ncbi:MAG: thiamine diphosphokinase [Clostridia bacterium]|nr:thiamine diphosphokinase [Clostridia bacterium]